MRHTGERLLVLLAVLAVGCAATTSPPDVPRDAAEGTDEGDVTDLLPADVGPLDVPADDPGPTDTPPEDTAPDVPLPPPGNRSIGGRAHFFNAEGPGQILEIEGVEGAEVFLLEYPSVRQFIGTDGLFVFPGLAEGLEVTLGLLHPDYFPSLTSTFTIGDSDLTDVTFQAVNNVIALYLGALVGTDPSDATRCSMVATITAIDPSQGSIWALGEPGVTVEVDPPVPPAQGPFYFDETTVPDLELTVTTQDGGAMFAGTAPGVYTWTARKAGLAFKPRRMKCVGGWLTNASPPHGMQAMPE
jgi:hypothetical protein